MFMSKAPQWIAKTPADSQITICVRNSFHGAVLAVKRQLVVLSMFLKVSDAEFGGVGFAFENKFDWRSGAILRRFAMHAASWTTPEVDEHRFDGKHLSWSTTGRWIEKFSLHLCSAEEIFWINARLRSELNSAVATVQGSHLSQRFFKKIELMENFLYCFMKIFSLQSSIRF